MTPLRRIRRIGRKWVIYDSARRIIEVLDGEDDAAMLAALAVDVTRTGARMDLFDTPDGNAQVGDVFFDSRVGWRVRYRELEPSRRPSFHPTITLTGKYAITGNINRASPNITLDRSLPDGQTIVDGKLWP